MTKNNTYIGKDKRDGKPHYEGWEVDHDGACLCTSHPAEQANPHNTPRHHYPDQDAAIAPLVVDSIQ